MRELASQLIIGSAMGALITWLLVNVTIGCGEPYGSCWLVPWVASDTPQ